MADFNAMVSDLPFSYTSTPVQGAYDPVFQKQEEAYRGPFSSVISQNDIAREDWLRSEQSSENAFLRDLYSLSLQQSFQSDEAQKVRDYEERMSNTAYQRAMADLKASGINPVLGLSNSGASSPSAVSPSGGSSGSARGNQYGRGNVDIGVPLVSGLFKILAGVVTENFALTATGASEVTRIVSDGSGKLLRKEVTTGSTRKDSDSYRVSKRR